MVKLYDVNAIKEEIQDLRNTAESIIELAEKENRPLKDDEQSKFDEIVNSSIPELEKTLATAEKFAEIRKEKALAAMPRNPERGPGSDLVDNPLAQPANRINPFLKLKGAIPFNIPAARLRSFSGETAREEAFCFGMYILSQCSPDRTIRHQAQKWLDTQDIYPEVDQADIVPGIKNAVTGTETVPKPLSDRLIEYREMTGAARQLLDVYTMSSETLDLPKMTAGQTVYYPAKAAEITASDPTFAQVNLVAVKRATLTQVANETNADSIVGMADRVASRAAYQLAWREDEEFVGGDGSAGFGSVTGLNSAVTTNVITEGTPTAKVAYFGSFMDAGALGSRDSISLAQSEHVYFKEDSLGIRATSRYDIQIHQEDALAALNVQAVANVTLDHLHSMAGAIPGKYHAMGLSWLFNPQFFFGTVQKLVYAQGGNTVVTTENGMRQMLFGFPVVLSSAVPASE